MSDFTPKMSNDMNEFLFVSTTDATEATTTTKAIITTTASTATATTATTTSEATTTEEPATEAATTTTEQTTTTAPPLLAAEVVMNFEETTTMAPPTTGVPISIETATTTTEQTITAAPTLAAEEVSSTEETIDWSTFADELEEKVLESAGSDEDLEPASEEEVSDKVLEPKKEVSIESTSEEGSDKEVEPKEKVPIESKSYFSCSSPVVADDGSITPPGKAILLEYDYDLTTNTDLDDNTLSGLDDRITMHLAEIYGLTSCRRRHLRRLKADIDILALDSKPVDVSVANTSECVTKEVDKTGSCTAIKGFMTAYVDSNSDAEGAKTKLLSLIEEGMASSTYTDDDIIKTSYIGSRPVAVAGDVVDDTKVPVVSEIQAVPLKEKDPPTLAIGISVFLLGFAALVLLYAFFMHRSEKDIEESSGESTQQPVKPDVEKVESAESTVDLNEKETPDLDLPSDVYGNVASNTLSSSDEEEDLQIAMTEDYSDLAHHLSSRPDINQVHNESCLAVIDSDSEERSFETGTPITTPITSPVSSPKKLLPCILSPEPSVEEDLLADVVYYGTTLDSIPI